MVFHARRKRSSHAKPSLVQLSGGCYSLQICIDVSNPSAKPSAKLPRCEGHLPRASFYISLDKCFRGPSAGKLLLETKEGSFREAIRAHGLQVNVLGNSHPTDRHETTMCKSSFSGNLPRIFRDCGHGPSCFVDMSTSIHICLSGKINRHSVVDRNEALGNTAILAHMFTERSALLTLRSPKPASGLSGSHA